MSSYGVGGPVDEPDIYVTLGDHERRIAILEALVQRIDTEKAVIDVATTGDHTIIAGVTGSVMRIISLSFLCGGDVDVQWFDEGGKPLSGLMPFPERGGISDDYCESGEMVETDVDEGVVLNLSADVQVGGYITVELRDPA